MRNFLPLWLTFVSVLPTQILAQPFVDILQINHQFLSSTYVKDTQVHHTHNSFANLLLPIKLDSSHILILRCNTERMEYFRAGDPNSPALLHSIIGGVGLQKQFNKKLNVTGIFMPRITSEWSAKLSLKDYQLGGSLLFQYKIKPGLRYKAGLYYNREPFGNFFVPLLGIDWNFKPKWWLYGNLPLSMRLEYQPHHRIYTGLGVRIYGRSYRLGPAWNYSYLWNQENQLKYFVDVKISEKLVTYAELGKSLGYGLKRYGDGQQREMPIESNPIFGDINQGYFLNLGIALRIRNGF